MLCQHNNLFFDFSTADEICLDCGVITMERIPDETSTAIHAVGLREDSKPEKDPIIGVLQDVGSNANLADSIRATAIDNYQCLKEKRDYKYTPRKNLGAYALYCAFHDHCVPRTMEEVTALTGVPCSKLWRLESRNISSLRQCTAAEIFPRYAHHFQLKFHEQQKLTQVLNSMKEERKLQSKSTKSLCAAVILKYLKDKNRYKIMHKRFYSVFGLYPYQIMHIMKEIHKYE